MTIEDRVRTFIITELRWPGSGQELTASYPLIERHVIDSLGIFQMITWLESEFGLEVTDEEIVPEHFGTIADIVELIEAKRGELPTAQ